MTSTPPTAPVPAGTPSAVLPETRSAALMAGTSGHAEEVRAQASEAVGSLTDLQEGQVLLPTFVAYREENGKKGLFVDLSKLSRDEDFSAFVERTFASNAFFRGVDVKVLQELAFDTESLRKRSESIEGIHLKEIRFADGVAPIPPERAPLYRPLRTAPNLSDSKYFFEKVYVDVEEPYFDPTDEQTKTKTVAKRAYLDFDEFVAHLWKNGVRYGILEEEIRKLIALENPGNKLETVARQLDPIEGRDASTEERTDKIHQKNAPKILPNGRIDLAHFENRFPQVTKDTEIMAKIPRVLGTPGRNVMGGIIEPKLPLDFDLRSIKGPGTRIEERDGKEILIADMDGFIDRKNDMFSIVEKIVNEGGVSVRTTGNIEITADMYEEKGDVEEGRTVRGKSMVFHKNVFGHVVSEGGTVSVAGNVSGGSVRNENGNVVGQIVQNRDGTVSEIQPIRLVSSALIETKHGEALVDRAENSVIVARKAVVRSAVGCVIVADDVEMENCESCSVVGLRISIKNARIRNNSRPENVITLEVPDFAETSKRIEEENKMIVAIGHILDSKRKILTEKSARYAELMAHPHVQAYLKAAKQVAGLPNGAASLKPEQTKAFGAMKSRVAKELAELAELSPKLKSLQSEVDGYVNAVEEKRAKVEEYHAEMTEQVADGIRIAIGRMEGETHVRTRAAPPATRLRDVADMAAVKKASETLATGKERLFHAASGAYAWEFVAPVQANAKPSEK